MALAEMRLSRLRRLTLLLGILPCVCSAAPPKYTVQGQQGTCGAAGPYISQPSFEPVSISVPPLVTTCPDVVVGVGSSTISGAAKDGDVSAGAQTSGIAAAAADAVYGGTVTLKPTEGSGDTGVTFSVSSNYTLSTSGGAAGFETVFASVQLSVLEFDQAQVKLWSSDGTTTGLLNTDQLTFASCPCVFTIVLNASASALSGIGQTASANAEDPFTINLPPGWTYTIESAAASNTAASFVPVTPCRIADTRGADGPFGGPSIQGGTSRPFPIPQSACNIPATAQAYSLNVTVVPHGGLGYLTIWPTGETQPLASTLNSFDGRIKANAAIVPAGTDGSVSVFVTNDADVVLDINGYFVPTASSTTALAFYPLTPCRVADTRNGDGALGGPSLGGGASKTIPVATTCSVPADAQAYSLNFTVVPHKPLSYLTTWPTGQARPLVSTLNAPTGAITANAAIVPAGANQSIDVFVTNQTDLVIDINGYFATPATGGLSFYSVTPCRVSDTRGAAGTFGGPTLGPGETRTWPVPGSACGISSLAQAYSLNATVVPPGTLAYLTLWPAGGATPLVSTLNSFDASVVANAAIVPAGTDGSINSYVTDATDLILDISGYFAP